MRTQREQARLQGDAATERGREPGTIPALRCGRRAVPDPAAVPAALSSSRAARARPAVLRPGSVPLAPGPVPPGAPSSQVPCRPPAPRRRRPTTRPGRASPSRPAAHSGGRRAHRARRRGVRGRATDAGTARRPAASPAAAARVGIAPRPLGLRVRARERAGPRRGSGAGPGASGRPPHLSAPPPPRGIPLRQAAQLRAAAWGRVAGRPLRVTAPAGGGRRYCSCPSLCAKPEWSPVVQVGQNVAARILLSSINKYYI